MGHVARPPDKMATPEMHVKLSRAPAEKSGSRVRKHSGRKKKATRASHSDRRNTNEESEAVGQIRVSGKVDLGRTTGPPDKVTALEIHGKGGRAPAGRSGSHAGKHGGRRKGATWAPRSDCWNIDEESEAAGQVRASAGASVHCTGRGRRPSGVARAHFETQRIPLPALGTQGGTKRRDALVPCRRRVEGLSGLSPGPEIELQGGQSKEKRLHLPPSFFLFLLAFALESERKRAAMKKQPEIRSEGALRGRLGS
ncbi:hypothetical protein NDU88_003428 [Pleurodeles waltl]|uniref:Uncharacterized protein n=1 Tax=Pleurodeles waltl TaxID=8319 RepID=A0AAV7VDA3_PLEWA|nr:hypothetical protein NDU88_003428 [Pleurodeles waltl]